MTSDPVIIAFILILAVVLDYLIMVWLHRAYLQRGGKKLAGGVYLFSIYSPVLSWLKQLIRPNSSQSVEQSTEPVDDQGGRSAASPKDEIGIIPPLESQERYIISPAPLELTRKSIWSSYWLEWVVIFVAVTLFCIGILDLNAPTYLPGNESEVFQMMDWTLINSLRHYHAFPLWNIYIKSGIPYVADPMLHVYNPVVTLPVLLFGVRAGFKLGVYFSFLIAAFGMWRLAATLGMGRVTRLWTALMFAFAGQPVARFFQGQYLFVFGFAYIPWIVSSLFLVTQRRCRRDIAVAVASLGLLFFSGNAYYAFYTLLVVGLFGVVMLFRINKRLPFINLELRHTLTFLFIGILALGVIAIQLLPTVEFWPRVSKDLNLAGSQSVGQIFLDYTSKDSHRPDAYSILPASEEFYAYIGLTPFLGLALLPLAVWKRDRRTLLFFILIVLLTVIWISLDIMPWKEAFLHFRLLLQFRHLLRILIFGSFALIVLAGMGLDTLWKLFENALKQPGMSHAKIQRALHYAGMVVLGAFLLYGVGDLFKTNRVMVQSQAIYQPAYDVMNWVRQNDLGDYYVRHDATNAWYDATIANNLRYIDVWYHFNDIRSLDGKINERLVQAQPYYLTQSPSAPVSDKAELIAVVDDYDIFKLPESLPMAFVVDGAKLQLGSSAGPLQRSEVVPLVPFFSSPNKAEVIVEGQSDQMLVLLMTHYPGWRVKVDGQFQELKNVSGYMAVGVQAGVHKYSFYYEPRPFFIGLLISLVASGVTLYLLLSDPRFSQKAIRQRWQAWLAMLRQLRQRLATWWEKLPPIIGEAIHRKGILHPGKSLKLAEETRVRVTGKAPTEVSPRRAAWRLWTRSTIELLGTIWRAIPLETALFIISIGVYLLIRFIGLVKFPIFFFTDEAIQTMSAIDLLNNHLRSPEGILLPAFFKNGPYYNLGLSVYLQIVPYLLLGKSIFITRATSVVFSLVAAVSVSLTLRQFFNVRHWWAGVLLLSIAPTWFLHSRTAFETVIFVSCYAGFIVSYLLYRCRSPSYLYLALIMAGLAFYSYSPGQLVIAATGITLLFLDMRYHWENRKMIGKVLIVLVIIALPYIRFRLGSTFTPAEHLQLLNSYWIQPISLGEKLSRFWAEYSRGLSVHYWFIPNNNDLERHTMKGYGNLPLFTLPFFIIGLILTVWNIRRPAYRVLLVALLAAPLGSSLVGIGITRVLVFIIPATLLIVIGMGYCLDWLEKVLQSALSVRPKLHAVKNKLPTLMSIGLFLLLVLGNILLARDALVNGPLWFSNYGLGGMQYGASQLFPSVTDYQKSHPDAHIIVSPSWANGTNVLARFFSTGNEQFEMGSIEGYLFERKPLDENTVFVMIPDEYQKTIDSGKFTNIRIDQTLPYPNGQVGFYFVRLQYVDNIDEILAAEQELRNALQEATISISGEPVQVSYSMLDMGTIDQVFDGDRKTVARTLEANPFIIELTFPEEHQLSGYKMVLGSADIRVTAILYPAEGEQPLESVADFDGSPSNPELDVNFGQTVTTQYLRFEILQPYTGVPSNVHVWEIELK
jgi:hypothetical protein